MFPVFKVENVEMPDYVAKGGFIFVDHAGALLDVVL